MQTDDDPEAADLARRRLTTRRSFLSLFKRKSASSLPADAQEQNNAPPSRTPTDDWPLMASLAVPQSNDFIDLDGSDIMPDDNTRDVYRWAIIFENQRGYAHSTYLCLQILKLTPESPYFRLHIVGGNLMYSQLCIYTSFRFPTLSFTIRPTCFYAARLKSCATCFLLQIPCTINQPSLISTTRRKLALGLKVLDGRYER